MIRRTLITSLFLSSNLIVSILLLTSILSSSSHNVLAETSLNTTHTNTNHHHVNKSSSCQTDRVSNSSRHRTVDQSALDDTDSTQFRSNVDDDKYATSFQKRTLKQFAGDVGFNFAPQIDFRDFSRVLPYQGFPPLQPPSRGIQPEELADYSDLENGPFRDIQGRPQSQPQQDNPGNNNNNFAPPPPRQPSFQRIRLNQPNSQVQPISLPPRQISPLRPSVNLDDDRSTSSLSNDPSPGQRFQRVRRPVVPSERPDNLPLNKPQNIPDSGEVLANRQPSSNQQFRRLPIQRNRQPVREPDERIVRRPINTDSEELVSRPISSSEEILDRLTNLPQTPRPRKPLKPTQGSTGSRRVRPANRNRVNGNINRIPSPDNPDTIVPTAVVITKPPVTPIPTSSEETDVERLPIRDQESGRRPVRIRQSVRPNVSSRRRPIASKFASEFIAPSRLIPESSAAPDEELIGNNAVDGDVVLNGGFGSKIRDDVAITKIVPIPLNSNGPVVVDYLTTFTYLTTVIRGPHTLLTTRESTTAVQVTQPYDPSIAEIVSFSAGKIRPTKTVNLGTKTKGPTTTIVNMQSNVQIANYEFISTSVKPDRAPVPTRSSAEFRRTRRPVIETAPKSGNILRPEHLKNIPKTFYTQYTYFYTVYDAAKTRRSTRSEISTAPVAENDLATLALDTTVNNDGLLSLGSGPSTVNLGKRVFGGSTTEVNLAMKTYLKLDGVRNVVVEPTATHGPHLLSQEITVKPSEVYRRPSLVPSLEASTRPLLESGFSSVPELDRPLATPSIIPISSDIRTLKTRRPVRVSSTALNSDVLKSRLANGRIGQRIRQRPPFSRVTKSKVSAFESDFISEISSAFSPELVESVEIVSSPLDDGITISPTAVLTNEPDSLESDAITSSQPKRASVSLRRPFPNDRLRSRLRRPIKPASTSEPKYVVVTRSAASPVLSSSSVQVIRSSKSRFRIASRFGRPNSSPVFVSSGSSISSSSVVSESIIPSSSVVVTYYSTTTHTVPFTMNEKTLMTTFEETNTRVATEPLDVAGANQRGKITKISDGVTLLLSSNLEPSSPITLEPTLITGAAVHMRDGLSKSLDMDTKTVYTTYTYFTTYYSGSSSVVSSSEQIVSNLVTLPKETQIQPSTSTRSPITVVETTEKIETSTIYSTYTYFATLFNGTKSTITPIEETRSEVLTLREPIRITRTINPPASSTNSLFTRTYYTTYTKDVTLTEKNVPTTRKQEQVSSSVVTFTLTDEAKETPAFDLSRLMTTKTINQFSAYPSLFTTKSTLLTSTHFITLFSGTQTILSSFEEVTPTVVTQFVGSPTIINDDNQRLAYSKFDLSSPVVKSSSRDLMTALVPSVSTLHVTHTYYTTFFNGHTSIVSSRTEATSSLVTLYVPQANGQSTNKNDQVVKSESPISSTPSLPQLRSSVNLGYRKRFSNSINSQQSSIRVDQLQSSILSRVVENLKSSQGLNGLSDEQISSALLGGQNIGKSTTVIDGSTVVFFTDLILNPSSSVFAVKSTILPSKPDGTSIPSIKPGMVIELSDLLAGASNGNFAGGLGSAIKDIVHLIASNTNGKLNESSIFDGDKIHIPHGGVIKVKNDQEPVYIPLGGKPKVNDTSSFSDSTRVDESDPVYRPDLNIEESGSLSEVESDDHIRKNDVFKRKNHNALEGSRKSHSTLVSSIVSPSSDSSSSHHHDTPPLSSSYGGGLHTQIHSGATTIFFTDNNGLTNPTETGISPTSTRYITSVESMTRTLTLTTTKVYYTRDSPLTITSVLTTTIAPRTFVSTIIGSRTILGTAGESSKTVELENAKPVNEEAATTVTTTTLIFNSITTTVVRTLVIPSVQASKTTTSIKPSRKPYTPFKPPQRSTTPSSVSIRPPGSRTRSPYLAKYKPSTPKPISTTSGTSETVPINNDLGSKKVNTISTKLYDDDQCRPACNSANKEMCREIDGIFKCECRPGFARKENNNICEAMQSYVLILRLMKVGETSVSYNSDLSDSSSSEYQKLVRLTKEELDRAYRNTSIKDNYINADVNMIKNPIDGDEGVIVNMTVHISNKENDDVNLDNMQTELAKTLSVERETSESLPSPSSIVADIETVEDFDECSDEKYNDCDSAARCINMPGSYACECKGAYTDMDPLLPGRICAAEIKNCEACHGRGDCVRSEDGEKTTCKCQRMYLGEKCEINGLLLATFLPIAAIFSIVSVCCVVYCCRKYKKKSNYPKGFKNLVAYPPPTIGANTLDRKAMLETSSESSDQHFRNANHDTNGMGHFANGNGSTRRYGHPEIERAIGGSYVTMPPQISIPRVRHPNQNCELENMIPKSCMKGNNISRGQIEEDECGSELKEKIEPLKRRKSASRISSRAESRPESRNNHHDEEDFIEWIPKKMPYEKPNESDKNATSSDCKSRTHKALSDLRIGHFDWQWKMLRQGTGSYSPNNRGKKKSFTDDRSFYGASYMQSQPVNLQKRKDLDKIKHNHNLSLVSEKGESEISNSTLWTGNPIQYHLADDLISLERRSQVSNWGGLPFYDN